MEDPRKKGKEGKKLIAIPDIHFVRYMLSNCIIVKVDEFGFPE